MMTWSDPPCTHISPITTQMEHIKASEHFRLGLDVASVSSMWRNFTRLQTAREYRVEFLLQPLRRYGRVMDKKGLWIKSNAAHDCKHCRRTNISSMKRDVPHTKRICFCLFCYYYIQLQLWYRAAVKRRLVQRGKYVVCWLENIHYEYVQTHLEWINILWVCWYRRQFTERAEVFDEHVVTKFISHGKIALFR